MAVNPSRASIFQNGVRTIGIGTFEGCDSLPFLVKSDIIQRFGQNVF